MVIAVAESLGHQTSEASVSWQIGYLHFKMDQDVTPIFSSTYHHHHKRLDFGLTELEYLS